MTVDEFLHYTAQLRNIDKKDQVEAVEKVLKTCALKNVQFQTIDTFQSYKEKLQWLKLLSMIRKFLF